MCHVISCKIFEFCAFSLTEPKKRCKFQVGYLPEVLAFSSVSESRFIMLQMVPFPKLCQFISIFRLVCYTHALVINQKVSQSSAGEKPYGIKALVPNHFGPFLPSNCLD